MVGDKATLGLAVAGLVFGILATLGCSLVSMVCCALWCRTKKELHLLKYQLERGFATTSADPNMMPLPPVQSSGVATPTNPSLLVRPALVDVSKGYSSVNQLSLLPDEVRTAENLEGDTIPGNREEELLLQYQKQRADYEEKQLQKMTELKAKRDAEHSPKHEPGAFAETVQARPTTPPHVGGQYDLVNPVSSSAVGGPTTPPHAGNRYDHVTPLSSSATRVRGPPGGIDPYEDPADAVSHRIDDVPVKARNSPMQHTKVMKVGASIEEYTPVFNILPKGQVEMIATTPKGQITTSSQPRTIRALSDSSPTSRASPSNQDAPPQFGQVANDSSPGSKASGDKSSPGCPGEARTDIAREQDGTRHSNRKMSKEVVEFDPNKQRKFRVTSSMKKRSKVDGADQADGGSLENSQNEDGSQQPSVFASPRRSQGFDQKGELSYAMVNMVDKKKNRIRSDPNKVDGSGTPQHYNVPLLDERVQCA